MGPWMGSSSRALPEYVDDGCPCGILHFPRCIFAWPIYDPGDSPIGYSLKCFQLSVESVVWSRARPGTRFLTANSFFRSRWRIALGQRGIAVVIFDTAMQPAASWRRCILIEHHRCHRFMIKGIFIGLPSMYVAACEEVCNLLWQERRSVGNSSQVLAVHTNGIGVETPDPELLDLKQARSADLN